MTSRAPAPYYVLNPRTIGRPIHLIDKFTAQVHEDLTDRFCAPLNRRYRAAFKIGAVSLAHSAAPREPQQRWLNYQSELGRIGFAPGRDVLLCILAYRFGTRDSHDGAAPAVEPASASEERLTAMLGAQMVSIVAGRIEAQQTGTAAAGAAEMTEVSAKAPAEDDWALRVDVMESRRKLHGVLWFVLDAACMERLLNSLSLARSRAAAQKTPTPARPLPARLQFTLTARLLEKEIALGVLLDTHVGDVIPISLRGADVLIGGSRLFTASIAEHKGKLCLTSFDDVE